MNKKVLGIIILIIVVIIASIGGYYYFNGIKEEYESLNGKTNDNNKKYREVSISSVNPIIYKSAEEVAQMIDDKETFVVYFGYNSCPWCRSVISTFIETAKELHIDKVYYVNVHDIRDVITLNSDNELETTKKGSEGYYSLIKKLDNVLADYDITDEVKAPEKRIYAPNVVVVIKGVGKALTTGISESQDDAYMTLTPDMVEDTQKQFKEVLESNGVKAIDAVGKPFDPSLHEAVSLVEDSSLGAKIVKEEYRKGYMIGDRVLRHSMVVVAN